MRCATITRKTKETNIVLKVNLDGDYKKSKIDTKIGFFDHMLAAFAFHSKIELEINCNGDIHVDSHHTIEDVGICLGMAIKEAIGDKSGIARFGQMFIPMDEALCFCAVDISGRPYLVFDADFKSSIIGSYDIQMTKEFFYAFAINSGITLHLKCEYGENDHHITEGLYKSFAYSLKQAITLNGCDVPSTKGIL